MNQQTNTEAQLTYLTEKQCGKSTPYNDCFRILIKFPFQNEMIYADNFFLNTELIFPGDISKSRLKIIAEDVVLNKIYIGLDFDFYEAEILIGHGVITSL